MTEFSITQDELIELLIVKSYLSIFVENKTITEIDPEYLHSKIKFVTDGISRRFEEAKLRG